MKIDGNSSENKTIRRGVRQFTESTDLIVVECYWEHYVASKLAVYIKNTI